MMIKVDSSYIELEQDPVMVKQAKTADLLDAAGDFSYQFDIQNTAEIRTLLGLKSIYTPQFNVDAELVTNDGVPIYQGILNVEGIEKYIIHCSFISGNSDWFVQIKDIPVYNIPLSYLEQYKEIRFSLVADTDIAVTPFAPLVVNWDNTEGIVFPLVDRGRLRNWSVQSLFTDDFMPWTFIKHIMTAIFQSNGLNFEGDLFSDGLYNQIIVTTAATNDVTLPYFEGLGMNVGKSGTQSIGTSPTIITFDLSTFPYYVGSYQPWNGSNTYTSPIDFYGYLSIDLDFSTSVTYTIELMVNGVSESTIEGTGAEVSKTFQEILPGIYRPTTYLFEEGDTVQVQISIASGSANILAGATLKMQVFSLMHYYPQFLVGGMTQGDFIKSVFTMFNVVSSFDPKSKTVTCSLFKNITENPVSLSQYLDDYQIDTIEVLQDLGKQMIFKHQEGITDEAKNYNEVTPVPWGAELIEPGNRLLTDTKEVETQFTAAIDYFNELVRASLIDIGGYTINTSGEVENFASVTNDAGEAQFHTVDEDGNPKDHGLRDFDPVLITGTANGEYLGMGYVQAGPFYGLAADEFRIRRMDFVSNTTGHWQRLSITKSDDSDHVFVGVYVPRGPVTNFSKLPQIRYSSTYYTDLPWAYFLKQTYGVPYDEMRLSPAFGQPENYFMFPLIDNYWELYRQSLASPVKVFATMYLPESVYLNIRFDRAVHLLTEEFSGTFFIQKIEGYVGSHKPCNVHFVKIS